MIPNSGSCRVRIIKIAEMVISDDPSDELITYSLGSCVGVAAWDKTARVGGMIHCLLPSARNANADYETNPARFVDVGVTEFLEKLFEKGARRESLVIKVAGAGSPLKECGGMRIGERNHATLKKVLWKNSLLVEAERVGGGGPRTLALRILDGRTTVRSGSNQEEI